MSQAARQVAFALDKAIRPHDSWNPEVVSNLEKGIDILIDEIVERVLLGLSPEKRDEWIRANSRARVNTEWD